VTHLYLIRHADYRYELHEGKYQNLGLTPQGVTEAERLRDRLAVSGEIKPDVFISSTERGAHETAQMIQSAFDKPIVLDEAFEEWRSEDGTLTPEEFMARWNAIPKAQKPYYRWVEGGENRMEFSLRVHLALNRILQEHEGKTIVIMTHGAFIQISFLYFFGFGEASLDRASPEIKRTSITHWLRPENMDRWVLERSNDYQHLAAT
jgi:2,3-bisphosphoglycerate-dependent phosphoglycerate mutase